MNTNRNYLIAFMVGVISAVVAGSISNGNFAVIFLASLAATVITFGLLEKSKV